MLTVKLDLNDHEPVNVKATGAAISTPLLLERLFGDAQGDVSADGKSLTFTAGHGGESRFKVRATKDGRMVEDTIAVLVGPVSEDHETVLRLVADRGVTPERAPEPVRHTQPEPPRREPEPAPPRHETARKHR